MKRVFLLSRAASCNTEADCDRFTSHPYRIPYLQSREISQLFARQARGDAHGQATTVTLWTCLRRAYSPQCTPGPLPGQSRAAWSRIGAAWRTPHRDSTAAATEPIEQAAKARSRPPGCRPLIRHRHPTFPAHSPSIPATSGAIGGALIALERPASTQTRVVSGRDRAEEWASSSSETHCDGGTWLILGPGGPQTPPEASAQLDRRPEGSGDARTAAGMLTG